MTQNCCEHQNILRTYPIFYQYGKYSVNLSELTKQDIQQIQEALAPLNITLTHKSYNF